MSKLATQTTISSRRKAHKVRGEICPEINRPCFFTQVETEVQNWCADTSLTIRFRRLG